MFRRLVAGLSALATSFVAACDDAPVSTVLYNSGRVMPYLSGVTARGPLLVETVNNPFDVSNLWLGETVAGYVRQSVTHRVIQTTSDPLKAYEPSLRMRFAFSPPKEFDPRALCRGEVPPLTQIPQRMSMLGVFCQGEQLEAAIWGIIRQPSDPTDERIRALVMQMTLQMFAPVP